MAWLQPRRGRAQVPGFFEVLAAVEFHVSGEVHVFQFDERGQVCAFRHACDSWQHAMALRDE